MAKRQKEIKQKQSKMFKETEKKQQRIVKNLQKLAKKSKNLLSHISNSKSTLNIHKANETERSNLGLTMTKNHSILRTSSKVLLSGTKLAKTQRKPKMKKIKAKIDSPSKILSSDSEFDEMSPKRFLDYWGVISQYHSDNADNNYMMPLQRNRRTDEKEHYDTEALEIVDNDWLRDINDGTQHGWLASQHETENESNWSVKNKEEGKIGDLKSKQFESPKLTTNLESSNSATPIQFSFKRNFESLTNQSPALDSPQKQNTQPIKKPAAPSTQKTGYKSIIWITAAIIIQKFWREYRSQRTHETSKKSVILDTFKKTLELNSTIIKTENHVEVKTNEIVEEIEEQKFEDAPREVIEVVRETKTNQDDKATKDQLEKSEVEQRSLDLSNLFDLQEKAISEKELTQKCLIHKMLK